VASWGLYLAMVAKSPESQTTVYRNVLLSVLLSFRVRRSGHVLEGFMDGGAVVGMGWTYGASGLELVER